MFKKVLLLIVMLIMLGSTAFATVDVTEINFNVVTSGTFDQSLRRWITTLNTDIAAVAGTERGIGSIFYVNSNAAANGAGTSWSTAYDTLQEGIDACTANKGDIIYVAQNHEEDITNASALDADCAGISIIGIGNGSDMPTLSFIDDVTAEMTISDPDVLIYNIRFLGALSGGVTAGIIITADGDGARILSCEFREATSDDELLIMISVAAGADDLIIAGNSFIGKASGGSLSAIVLVGASDRTIIANNNFYGDWSDYVIKASGATSVEMLIANNIINNLDIGAGQLMTFESSSTGSVINNKCYGNGGTFALVAASMFVSPDNVFIETESAVRNYATMFGGFSGDGGVGQGDSIYADFVLAKSDLTAIIQDFLDYGMDELMSDDDRSASLAYPDSVVAESVLNFLMSKTLSASSYDYATDSLEMQHDIVGGYTGDGGPDNDDSVKADLDIVQADVTTVIAAVGAISDTAYVGTNSATSQTIPVVALLAGFGNDYFNTGWSMIVIHNENADGSAPEGEIRDITDYISLDGTFTVATFSANLESGDKVMLKRTEELELDMPTVLGSAGTVRYVDSGATNGDASGLTWENAYILLLGSGSAEAASSAGDIIYVADGHNEGWAHTSQPIINVTNLTIIGLGEGDARPLFDFDGTTSLVLTISAPGVTLKNLRFNPSATGMVKGIHFDSSAVGCTLENCSFIDGEQSNDEWEDVIVVDEAAENLTIKNCTFVNVNATADEGDTFINLESTPVENVSIIGCTIFGDFADAPIFWGAGVPVNLLIKDNIITNTNTGEMCIEGSGAATGILSGNRMYTDDFTAVLDPGSLMCFENYVSTAINTTAYLIPADDDELAEIGPGRIIYCDSGIGTAGDGRSWATGVKTLDDAINLCSDDRGDTIYIAAGHSEGTLSTTYATIDLGGITIIGLGNGELRPKFTYTGASGTLLIDNDDITIKNLHFISGVNQAVIAITVATGSENVRIEDCLFTVTTPGTHEFYHCIDHAGANHSFVIKNCQFHMGGGEAVAVVHFEDSDYAEIVGNEVHGAYSTACIHSDTTAADHIVIKRNILFNGTIGGIAGLNTEPAIELLSSTTGVICDNTIVCDEATPEDSIVGADMFLARNTYSEIEGTAGSRLIGDDQSIDVDIAALVGKGTGQVWYCDRSGSGEDGRSWASAFATVNAAVGACTADAGDIILVAEGHYELLSGADAMDLDEAGISLIGLGIGNARPRFDMTDAASEIVIGAANITIKNIQIRPGFNAVLKGIDIEAAGLNALIENVAFLDGEASTTDEVIDGIIVHSSATGITIRGCTYKTLNVTDGHVTTFINLDQGACVDITIEDNVIYGDFSEAPIWGASQTCLNLNIHNNILTNVNTEEHCIEFAGAATGMCTNNLMYADTRGAILDPGSMYLFGNKQVISINEGAEDVPLIAGKSYARVKTLGQVDAVDNLFTITGSPIMITSFVGHCTTLIGTATLNIQVNATAGGEDYDLSSDVAIGTVDQGGLIVFSNAILEGVTTPAPKGATGCAAQGLNWFVVPGVIESFAAGDSGEITWYMIFTPLGPGCEVVPQ